MKPTSPLPELASRYQVRSELGRGGTGCVYRVWDTYLQSELALKLLHQPPASGADLEQFQREFALLAAIEHPRIARAYDFGFAGERPYFTSELIRGQTLAKRRDRVSASDLGKIAVEVADAAAFLHCNKILHLDIKLSNIVGPAPNGSQSYEDAGLTLVDFGLYRRGLEKPPAPQMRGSLPYMAPEYFSGGSLTCATDVYALGVTLYRLATGRFPRTGAAVLNSSRPPAPLRPEANAAAWFTTPPLPSRIHPELPEALDDVLLRCLALDPEARFATAAELREVLQELFPHRRPVVRGGWSSTPTLDRDRELEITKEFIDQLQSSQRRHQALLVTASPGMGQSHFLRAVKMQAQMQGTPGYLETGYPGQNRPPGFLLRCLAAHIDPNSAASAVERWQAFLGRLRQRRRSSRNEASEGERRLRHLSEISLAAREVTSPFVLIVDGLQFFDEISISLVIDLLRVLADQGLEDAPPIGLVVGYREEGPSIALLRELTAHLLSNDRGRSITLRPLSLTETTRLYRRLTGPGPPGAGMDVFQETGGCPRAIAAWTSRAPAPSRSVTSGRAGAASRAKAQFLTLGSQADRDLVLVLELLERPAGARELARILKAKPAAVQKRLRDLEPANHVIAVDGELDGKLWMAANASGSGGGALAPSADHAARKRARERWHRAIAQALRDRARSDPGALVEAIRHFQLGHCTKAVVEFGPQAAEYLAETAQNRAAIALFTSVLQVMPRRHHNRRNAISLRLAELHGRVGDVDVGVRLLRDVLARSPSSSPRASSPTGVSRTRVLLRLATLHSRRGDFQRADALFTEALKAARRQRGSLNRVELLEFVNEHAAIKGFLGDYDAALKLCAEGLRFAGKGRRFDVREVVLNLHATRANVALRTFDLDGAVREFDRALEIAEAIGSLSNQAVILNNLGIVYGQLDRYDDAIAAFREAEQTCLRLDEGPSLTSIYGNLAVLYAKRGRFEEAAEALRQGEQLSLQSTGERQAFFLAHARALCSLYRGSYAGAVEGLDEAIRLGESMGDRYLVTFDRVFRAEARIFKGQYAIAERELDELSAGNASLAGADRIRRMALARKAFLQAILGCTDAATACAREYDPDQSPPDLRPIPFLDAWDYLFLGWAFALVGHRDAARSLIDRASSFFTRLGIAPGAALAAYVKAESYFMAGETTRARGIVHDADREPGNDLVAALWPLLEARLVLAEDPTAAGFARAGGLLARCGTLLVGHSVPEWELRLKWLRTLIRPETRSLRPEIAAERHELGRGLSDAAVQRYIGAAHWKLWTQGDDLPADAEVKPGARPQTGGDAGSEEPGTDPTATATLEENRYVAGSLVVARSPAMRRLLEQIDRLQNAESPILIHGETGTGKELMARTIHERSSFAGGGFHVVSSAAIPAGLAETELFGAKAGAFTDLNVDRPGLLSTLAGGTVLFDQITEISPGVQAKLLRVLSEGRFRPVGAEEEDTARVRFLFSTSRDIENEVREGRFRRDLYHRIQALSVDVPPLRERALDVPELVRLFLSDGLAIAGRGVESPPDVEPEALQRLQELPWPGNVRQLRNVVLRLQIENPKRISAAAVDSVVAEMATRTAFPQSLLAGEALGDLQQRLEREYFLFHLRRLGGDAKRLGEFLNLQRRQLYRRLQRLGISLRRERERPGERGKRKGRKRREE